ncbi:MAG: tetratricopeptide repeat protein [Spirochaetales bacterium]|nr:tetratricopeptide repeat protein [Spirochaetales bacterium]
MTFKLRSIVMAGLLLIPVALPAQDSGDSLVRRAITTFGQGLYDESLRLFRNVILNSSMSDYHGDSYFWIAKSYMALGQYENASKNLEFFLSEYPVNKYYEEGLYQRGRLDFLQGEHESAIQILEDFIDQYPDSSFAANSYFWIGESLYVLGHFDEALEIFETVEANYPTSFKIEAARYRISLIELKERERELLKLLKWSHEEYLRALEEFDRKEREYEQALIAYQRKIREYETATTEDPRVSSLQKQVADLEKTIQGYRDRLQAMSAEAGKEAPRPAYESELLELKEKALDLKAYYLVWLSALE